jgi:hypothetical protein
MRKEVATRMGMNGGEKRKLEKRWGKEKKKIPPDSEGTISG